MQADKAFMRWCLPLAILLLVTLAAPAAANCSGLCNTIKNPNGPDVKCSITPPKYSGHRGFSPTSFTYSCLADAGKDCAAKENAVDPSNIKLTCCGCFLYAEYCAGKQGPFVTNNNIHASKHTMVMPAKPCTGVEHHSVGDCPGEAIWNEAYRLLVGAGKQGKYGMAINPVQRRSEHQMHVHLAEVKSTLRAAVEQLAKSQTSGCIDCGGSSTLGTCSVVTGTCKPNSHLTVSIHSGILEPAAAKPFETVYGKDPHASGGTANVEQASALVMHVPNTLKFAVLSNPRGPAESMLDI